MQSLLVIILLLAWVALQFFHLINKDWLSHGECMTTHDAVGQRRTASRVFLL